MQLTVAICTWNRSALLRHTLDSLAAVRVPDGAQWEVLVVANACTDDTAEVVQAAATHVPLRLVEEPRLGLSHARNTAALAAAGDCIIWIDDDVLVGPGWLEAYCRAIVEHADAAFFGGPIRPWFPAPPPRWFELALPSVGNALSLLDYGAHRVNFDADHLPFGANFAVRTDIQRKHTYRTDLGRCGAGMRSGEETDVLHRILADGGVGVWVPDAALRHHVSPERQTLRYLRRYYFENGEGAALVGTLPPGVPLLLGRPRWVWREAFTHEALYWLTRPAASPAVWGLHLRRATTAWGRLRGGGRAMGGTKPLGASPRDGREHDSGGEPPGSGGEPASD